jgi:beta-1,4-N-acetylglucosaminyltransferase
MNIFVTVGTTKFDLLIEYLDKDDFFKTFNMEFQIANGNYIPSNHLYYQFVENIKEKYMAADIVITHGGAGTVYQLLEIKKTIIVVPNLMRRDKHQLDIAKFVDENNYGLVAYDFSQLKPFIKHIDEFTANVFMKDKFFKAAEIVNYFL